MQNGQEVVIDSGKSVSLTLTMAPALRMKGTNRHDRYYRQSDGPGGGKMNNVKLLIAGSAFCHVSASR